MCSSVPRGSCLDRIARFNRKAELAPLTAFCGAVKEVAKPSRMEPACCFTHALEALHLQAEKLETGS